MYMMINDCRSKSGNNEMQGSFLHFITLLCFYFTLKTVRIQEKAFKGIPLPIEHLILWSDMIKLGRIPLYCGRKAKEGNIRVWQ